VKSNCLTFGQPPLRLALISAVFFIVAVVFYGIVWQNAPILAPDSGSYLRAARDLSDFHIDELQERTPGYPLLLVVTGSQDSPNKALFFVSLFLHFASISMLSYGLYEPGVKEWAIYLFMLTLLLPPFVEPAAYVLTEVLAALLLTAAVVSFYLWYLHDQKRWLLCSSIATGCAALTRPAYQLLAIAFVLYLITIRFVDPIASLSWKKVRDASFFLIGGSVLIIGGYAFYNLRSFGHFTVTPKLGLTLSVKTARIVERLPDKYQTLRDTLVKARDEELLRDPTHRGSMYIWAAVPVLTNLTGLAPADLSDYMLWINLRLILKAPLTYLQEVAWAFVDYWFPASGELSAFGSRSVQAIWAVVHFCVMAAFWASLVLLFGAATLGCSIASAKGTTIFFDGMVDRFCKGTFLYGLAGVTIGYSALVSSLLEVGDPRYRVPTDPLITFMAVIGWQEWFWLVSRARTIARPPIWESAE